MSTELIKVTINGKEFQVAKGSRLIDVCRENEYDIPSFCYYSDLALQASCRMCLVRIEKMPKLQTSCTIICTDGMVVTTESQEIIKAQRAMSEFLLANHPLDCPVCDRGGECELQEMIYNWGDLEERFTENKNAFPESYLSPMVANDQQRCILCKRCTRVCEEWMGEDAIEAGNRGVNTVIGTFGGWLNCSQCGNCIEVCPTGTLLDGTYRHETRPWELERTTSTCTYCSDGCQFSIGSRNNQVKRVVARDRYVNGLNGEFLCVKGRFAHQFVNHNERIKTPLIRYKKGGKLIPATWDAAISFVAEKLSEIKNQHGASSIAVVGNARITNEANYAMLKFAKEVIGTENFSAVDAFSLKNFFANLGGNLATHKDIRHAKTILLIGGNPEELQPFTAKQIRQAVRNGGAKLILVNSTPVRLKDQAAQFIHIKPCTENAFVLAIADYTNDELAATKMGVEKSEIETARKTLEETQGDIVIMFGEELLPEAQSIVAQIPHYLSDENRRVLLHPLPIYSNSVGAHDVGFTKNVKEIIEAAGKQIKAVYIAGSFLNENLDVLVNLDFMVVQELFLTDTANHADVVLPAASFAEVDGTYTNNFGFVQRVRQAIETINQSKPDWVITSQIAREMGVDFGYHLAATAIFKELAESLSAYNGLRYPALKDESKPVQAKYTIHDKRDLSNEIDVLKTSTESLQDDVEKIYDEPKIGHELFKLGTLTSKTEQFHLLAAGNPKPDDLLVSPLYQIETLRREAAVAGD
jgi:NADH-quinone oxidoreductase subunit G